MGAKKEKKKEKKKKDKEEKKASEDESAREKNARTSWPLWEPLLQKLPNLAAINAVLSDEGKISDLSDDFFKVIAPSNQLSADKYHELYCRREALLGNDPPTDTEVRESWVNLDADSCGYADNEEFKSEFRVFLTFLRIARML